MSERTDVLQTLLDVQKFAGDIFDEIETGKATVTLERIQNMNRILGELSAVRDGFVMHYVMSGRASDDMLSKIRESLR